MDIGEWLEQAFTRFVAWSMCEEERAVLVDLSLISDALGEEYQGSYQGPCEAARRLAEAASLSPYAGDLVPFFDELAEAWSLVGSAHVGDM